MDFLRKLKIAPKLLAAFGAMVLLMLVLAAAAQRGLATLDEATTELGERWMVELSQAQELGATASSHRLWAFRLVLPVSEQAREEAKLEIENASQTFIESLDALAAIGELDAAEAEQLAAIRGAWEAYITHLVEVTSAYEMGFTEEALDLFLTDSRAKFDTVQEQLLPFITVKLEGSTRAREAAAAAADTARTIILVTLLVAVLLAVALGLLIARTISRGVGSAVAVANAVAAGRLDNRIDDQRGDEIGDLLRALARMQDDLRQRIEAERVVAEANLRIRNALDSASAAVMIADPDGKVIYANQSLRSRFAETEPAIAAVVAGFRAEALVGLGLGAFAPCVPALAPAALAALEGSRGFEAELGGRVYQVTATPIRNESGERIGTLIDWLDRSAEVAAERELIAVFERQAEGDFTAEPSLEGKQGFFLNLSRMLREGTATVRQSLSEVRKVMAALAEGDLTVGMSGDYKGVWAEIRDASALTTRQLRELIGQIQQAAVQINTGAAEVSAGNLDLSRRTEQQAANLEETAASMEELTSTVKQNADSARQANQLATGAASVAEQGGVVVGRVVETMAEIDRSSKRVADIIGTIDGIAFQTNILALNAAVEAARAGEQGRGFAVVAAEVRSLAQRSANAAKEIKELIEASVTKVGEGSQLVNQAGSTMAEIVGSVKRVTDIMAEISAASAEQSAGIEQVNQTIVQMDETTQQNAALVEEASAAARSMEEQAQALAEAVGRFNVGTAAVTAAPAALPSAARAAGRAVAPAKPVPKAEPKPEPRPAPKATSKPAANKPGAATPRPAPGKADASDGEWTEF
jgi:methyl-accepting chemotaxis protein